ncbi:hydroxyacid dehydrogenase [Geminisphaera colitermitum]|uniref:hydroxyacid dehydrogenase n=1 Tax=Geminisphaera colitermitum TaxID=1148786 RepID=UPI000158C8A3|nr:hydroxyacid dehydrogenase [Geminisphaera colitermitum]
MKKGLIVLESHAFELIYGEEMLAEIAHRVQLLSPRPLTKAELGRNPALLRDVEVIFSGWGAPMMDAAFLDAAPKLQSVFYGAGSIRGFTSEAFWKRSILVASAYAMNAIPVAEFTLGAVLLSLKNTWRYALGANRLGAHMERVPCAGGYGSKVGLISLGMIGRLVRERLRPFDLDVLAYDPFVTQAQATALDVEMVSLDDIFRRCDVVSLHTPWLKETEGMIQGRHFELMKNGATFINTARGAVVHEPGMIDVLTKRPDLTALLDVTYPEPPVAGSPFYTLPNVVLTPHIAGSQNRECRRMGRLMIDEFDRWERNEPMKWAISEEKAALLA